MMKRFFRRLLALLVLCVAAYAFLLFMPKDNGTPFSVKIERGQGIAAVSRTLATQDKIYNRWVLLSAAYLTDGHKQLRAGSYKIGSRVSTWQLLQHLLRNRPDTVSVQIIEGMRFAQMRQIINRTEGIRHDTVDWDHATLLAKITDQPLSKNPEGLFFPDRYEIDADSSDLQIYRAAYRAMQKHLNEAWQGRDEDLPYQTPYELLIMASIIEKETAHEEDRADVSAVFRNRLKLGMRLQTDPTVIYGMGDAYQGKIRKADLRRDTPYNTYTRAGLPPTPIALAGRAALNAAAHPSNAKYIYFVSRMDGTGKSQFSHTLEEHNAAVRQYILKKNP